MRRRGCLGMLDHRVLATLAVPAGSPSTTAMHPMNPVPRAPAFHPCVCWLQVEAMMQAVKAVIQTTQSGASALLPTMAVVLCAQPRVEIVEGL